MKGGTLYFGMGTIFMLVVVGIAIYISGSFQMLQANSGLIEGAGFIAVFVLGAVGFIALVRRQGCSVIKNWWHKRLILDRTNRVPKIFYLLLSHSACKSCPFISLCVGH